MSNGMWDEDTEAQVRQVVQSVVRLAESEEACRILGVDGTLEDEVDVSFLVEPLEWIANEIATALRQAEEDDEVDQEDEDAADDESSSGASLSTVVALARLYRIVRGGSLDQGALTDAVLEYLSDEAE